MYIIVCVYIYLSSYHTFLIHSSVDGHSGCFHILAIVNNAAVNIGVHVSFQISVFVFFRYIPSSRTAGSHGSGIFSFLRCTVFIFILFIMIYFWLHWVFVARRGLPLVAASERGQIGRAHV